MYEKRPNKKNPKSATNGMKSVETEHADVPKSLQWRGFTGAGPEIFNRERGPRVMGQISPSGMQGKSDRRKGTMLT